MSKSVSQSDVEIHEEYDLKIPEGGIRTINFLKPNFLISSNRNGTLSVIDIDKKEEIFKVLVEDNSLLFSVVHDENSVMTCTNKGIVAGYSFDFKKKKANRFYHCKMTSGVSRLLKMSASEYIAAVWNSKLTVVNVENNKLEKLNWLKKHRYLTFGFERSKKYENCFYITERDTGPDGISIHLINYKKNETFKILKGHSSEIYFIQCFINANNEEIVIGSSLFRNFYVYNACQGVQLIKTRLFSTWKYDYTAKLVEGRNRKILFVGLSCGGKRIVEVDDEGTLLKLLFKDNNVHKNDVYDITALQMKRGFIKIASACVGQRIHVVTYKSKQYFDFEDVAIDIDAPERTEYVKEHHNNFEIKLMGYGVECSKVFTVFQ